MAQHQNPFIIPILDILKQATGDLGEYDLIKTLEQQGFDFPVENDGYEMALFKKHFITMNALYHLQDELLADGYYLSISPLLIKLESAQINSTGQQLQDDVPAEVRDYYLDWQHFEKTRSDDVKAMLSDFWNRYYAVDQRMEAYQVLGIDEQSSHEEVVLAYRRLAAEYHPDKGGDKIRFIEIRQAYEVLCHALVAG
ncbi:MAG: DnaJ domain-containing protein [Gammaproteobacteria bacterium]|nr:DnaJ domain-containing protein [Gammaproteobacteria bacterium]